MRDERGFGERLELEGRRRYGRLMLVCVLAALAIIVVTLVFKRPGHVIAPGAGLALGLAYPFFMAWVMWRTIRVSDELEVRHNVMAAVFGMVVMLLGYPCWMFLWMGQLAPEPNHFVMFMGVNLAALAGYVWSKHRG